MVRIKNFFLLLFFLLIFYLALTSRSFVRAQTTQSVGLCYSQCGFYKFYWKGDFYYDMVQLNCTETYSLKDVVSLVKSIRKGFLTGKLTEVVDVTPIFSLAYLQALDRRLYCSPA